MLMACENCDYVDTMMPLDYLPASYDYGNRRQYHQWKMVGIQATHEFVDGGIRLDDSGRLVGIASGCKVIEEINQNNQIVGRGAWYLRGKSDGDGNNSAAYGLIGHCQSPGISDDAMYNQKPTAYSIEGYDNMDTIYYSQIYRTPMLKFWGKYQDNKLCSCSGSTNWRMGAFIEETYTDAQGKKQTRRFMQYAPDADCSYCGQDQACACECEAANSRLPGRFTSWICTSDLKNKIYNTCEATFILGGGKLPDEAPICYGKVKDYVTKNSITGGDQASFRLETLDQGVIVRLTSLPSCNYFHKLYTTKKTTFGTSEDGQQQSQICTNRDNPNYNPNDPNCFHTVRCERGVIRLAPSCVTSVSASAKGGKEIGAGAYFRVQEYHYDRWDRADGGAYKIFDELYDVPEFNYKVRILVHNIETLENYFHERPGYEKDTWLTKRYLTGGRDKDVTGDPKGCKCQNITGNNSSYPIRPYNNYTYCPNNFTCEKSC